MIEELRKRGLIHDISQEDYLGAGPVTFYVGFDLTATSLHVGSLIPLTMMKRLAAAGHKPIALLGTGTSKIGDPSGKSVERNLVSSEELKKNLSGISSQLSAFLGGSVQVVENGEWLEELKLIEFLRDIGKHFSVNNMMAKDSVRTRLETRDQGLSYTEFTYSLLQAYDFLELYRRYDCSLQLGGSDQWGNIVAGLDLIRRLEPEAKCFGLTSPLLTTASGSKFGKTESGTVWLDQDMTSPFQFYQFWLNTADEDIERFIKMFSFASLEEIEAVMDEHKSKPAERAAQKFLAAEMTTMLHGEEQLQKSVTASSTLFGGDIENSSADELRTIFADVPSFKVTAEEFDSLPTVADVLVHCKILGSKGDAKRLASGGGLYINSNRVDNVSQPAESLNLIDNELLLIRTGKKKYHILQVSPGEV